MDMNAVLREKKISKYRLAKMTDIPYTTISDIFSGKAAIEKCSAENVYKIANALNVDMEFVVRQAIERKSRSSFEVFKSNVCHRVKDMGDIDFIVTALKENSVRKYYDKKWYPEAFYLLAMIDYLSRVNNIPLYKDYSDIRSKRLSETLYPADILLSAKLADNDSVKENSLKEAIPEFLRFNIVESEVRNVV